MAKRQFRSGDYRAVDLIARKRDGLALSAAELRWLIDGFVRGEVADYQLSAFAMAVVLRGMSAAETVALTLAMRDSGAHVRIERRGRPRLDKHSTGGVGDKVSLCLAPLVAACGARVPMISGRGLGHTGGTLDKLEAIPGFRVQLPFARFARQVDRLGVAFMGQTREIAPADKRLYALRDVTATVDSVPLITASILSKKLATDLDALVMDIKVGHGAFMQSLPAAEELADSLIRVGRAAGLPVDVLFTAMEAPLGRAVGNALEAREAFELLLGRGPADLLECTLALGARMLRRGKLARNEAAARRMLEAALHSGRALSLMEAVVRAQG
ncbi:MAG TPA: thymidine phosphorylase, partial [Polyangiales bacterium]|nr:thymidine phosphorylase [Polyangiales bacterium]